MLRDHSPVCPVCDVGVLWPNGWVDQDANWYGGRPQLRRHCVRWGPSSPLPKKWHSHQDATWYGGRPPPRRHCVRWGPTCPTERGQHPRPPFGPCLLWPNGRPFQQLLSSYWSSYITQLCYNTVIFCEVVFLCK